MIVYLAEDFVFLDLVRYTAQLTLAVFLKCSQSLVEFRSLHLLIRLHKASDFPHYDFLRYHALEFVLTQIIRLACFTFEVVEFYVFQWMPFAEAVVNFEFLYHDLVNFEGASVRQRLSEGHYRLLVYGFPFLLRHTLT